ncbi:MAG TPA: hypothetical protein VFA96_10690 [Nocardioides sp.]|nr:hypothetical protein [Nocardioides sp.]
MKRYAAALAAVLVTALSVSACGSTTSASGPSSSTSSSSGSLPSGWQRMAGPRAQLSVAVPGDWTVVSAAKVTSDPKMAQRVAQLFKINVSQVPALFKQLDVIAFSPTVTSGFEQNLNVTLTPLVSLPAAATIQAGFRQLGATDIKVFPTSTPLGAGVGVTYQLPQIHVQGEEVYVSTKAGIAGVTLSAAPGTDPRTLMAQIVPTLQSTSQG